MSLDVKFSATDAGFSSTVSKVKNSVKSMDDSVAKTSQSVKTSFGSMVKAGAALAIGFGAIKAVASAITGTFDKFGQALALGGEMDDLNMRTGETIKNLVVLRDAFEFTGVGADKVGPSINKLQKFMDDAAQGSEKNNEVLGRLGLTFTDLAGKTPTEQMQMLANGLSGVADDGEKSALAIGIFGKSGGAMLPMLSSFSAELDLARDRLGSLPDVMQEGAQAFGRIEDNIATARAKFMEFAAGLLSELAPAIELATKLISNFDAAGAGMKLGEILTGASKAMEGFTLALEAIKLGEFGMAFKIAFDSIKLQAADSINSIYNNVKAVVEAAGQFLLTAFGPGSGIYTIIKSQFEILGAQFGSGLMKAISLITDMIPGLEGALNAAIASNAKTVQDAQNKISNASEQIIGDFETAGKRASATYIESLKSSEQLIDTTALLAKLEKDRLDVLAKQTDEKDKQTQHTMDLSDLEIKAGGQRVTNDERIVELNNDIVEAKREGNKEAEIEAEASKAYYTALESALKSGLTLENAITTATFARSAATARLLGQNQGITAEMRKQLQLSDEMQAKLDKAKEDAKVKGDERVVARLDRMIGQNNFEEAQNVVDRRRRKEEIADVREVLKQGNKNLTDIAKDFGVDTFRKSQADLLKELQEIAKIQGEEQEDRIKERDKPKPRLDDPDEIRKNTLQTTVERIRDLMQSLERKLPVPALGI